MNTSRASSSVASGIGAESRGKVGGKTKGVSDFAKMLGQTPDVGGGAAAVAVAGGVADASGVAGGEGDAASVPGGAGEAANNGAGLDGDGMGVAGSDEGHGAAPGSGVGEGVAASAGEGFGDSNAQADRQDGTRAEPMAAAFVNRRAGAQAGEGGTSSEANFEAADGKSAGASRFAQRLTVALQARSQTASKDAIAESPPRPGSVSSDAGGGRASSLAPASLPTNRTGSTMTTGERGSNDFGLGLGRPAPRTLSTAAARLLAPRLGRDVYAHAEAAPEASPATSEVSSSRATTAIRGSRAGVSRAAAVTASESARPLLDGAIEASPAGVDSVRTAAKIPLLGGAEKPTDSPTKSVAVGTGGAAAGKAKAALVATKGVESSQADGLPAAGAEIKPNAEVAAADEFVAAQPDLGPQEGDLVAAKADFVAAIDDVVVPGDLPVGADFPADETARAKDGLPAMGTKPGTGAMTGDAPTLDVAARAGASSGEKGEGRSDASPPGARSVPWRKDERADVRRAAAAPTSGDEQPLRAPRGTSRLIGRVEDVTDAKPPAAMKASSGVEVEVEGRGRELATPVLPPVPTAPVEPARQATGVMRSDLELAVRALPRAWETLAIEEDEAPVAETFTPKVTLDHGVGAENLASGSHPRPQEAPLGDDRADRDPEAPSSWESLAMASQEEPSEEIFDPAGRVSSSAARSEDEAAQVPRPAATVLAPTPLPPPAPRQTDVTVDLDLDDLVTFMARKAPVRERLQHEEALAAPGSLPGTQVLAPVVIGNDSLNDLPNAQRGAGALDAMDSSGNRRLSADDEAPAETAAKPRGDAEVLLSKPALPLPFELPLPREAQEISAPPPALSALALPPEAAELLTHLKDDPSAQISIMKNAAHVSIESEDGRGLDLHVRLLPEGADIRASGELAPMMQARAGELGQALAAEGVTLGRFQMDNQMSQQSGRQDSEERRARQESDAADAFDRATGRSAGRSGGSVNETTAPVRTSDGRIHVEA